MPVVFRFFGGIWQFKYKYKFIFMNVEILDKKEISVISRYSVPLRRKQKGFAV